MRFASALIALSAGLALYACSGSGIYFPIPDGGLPKDAGSGDGAVAESCENGLRDGEETDVDCGGGRHGAASQVTAPRPQPKAAH